MSSFHSPSSVVPSLDEVQIEHRGAVSLIRLSRPRKRNAINDGLMAAIGQRIAELPASTGAVVLYGEGEHFCAGLDLGELKDRDAVDGLHHSRSWYYVLRELEQGRVPVIALPDTSTETRPGANWRDVTPDLDKSRTLRFEKVER